MARYDWSRWFNIDLNLFSDWVTHIGLIIFIIGTLLAVWSGWRYIYNNRETFFAGANS